MSDDLYSRVDYRRFVAWPDRIQREWPFLEGMLGSAPVKRLLDLGCGTGEHARFLASRGFAVVGIDSSESMLEKARETPAEGVEFISGDIADVATLTDGCFGGAICLGNTLPHVREADALARLMAGLRARLQAGAPFVLQVLNYERIRAERQRFLPLNFRPEAGGEVVFLRLMDPRADGTVVFTPSTLRYRPDGDPPLEVIASRNVMLRGWTRQDLDGALETAGFRHREVYGAVEDKPYEPRTSHDLVMVAR